MLPPSISVTDAATFTAVSAAAMTLASAPTGRSLSTTAWASRMAAAPGAFPSRPTATMSTVPFPLASGSTFTRRMSAACPHHAA